MEVFLKSANLPKERWILIISLKPLARRIHKKLIHLIGIVYNLEQSTI